MTSVIDRPRAPQRDREPKVSRVVRGFDNALVLGASAVAVLCLVVVGVTLFVSVVLRYVSGASLPFATELPTFLFPWLVCAGIVAAAGTGGHLAVDFVVERMPAPLRRVVRTVMWLLVLVALVFLTVSATGLISSYANQRTPILGWPQGLSYLAFPVALVALVVHAAGRVVAHACGVAVKSSLLGSPELETDSDIGLVA